MYSFLLTDDEQIVIDTLTLIIRRNFGEDVKIFSALSGAAALEIVHKEKIDIMFMDIHMPGINGLETISLIKQINQNIIVIILSAYDQFEYAQEAINLGAFKYLTKPVNRNLIIQTIRNAMNLVDEQKGQLSNNIEMYEKLNFVSSIVESDFIYSCIFNNNRTTEFSTYLKYFKIQDKDYFMCCIEIPESVNKVRYKNYVKLRDILTGKCSCIIGSFMNNRVGVYVTVPESSKKDEEDPRKKIMNPVHLMLSMEISSGIRIGISEIESDIAKAPAAYNNAMMVLSDLAIDGGIGFFEDAKNIPDDKLSETAKNLSQRILARVKSADKLSLHRLVSEYVSTLFKLYRTEPDRIKNSVFELVLNSRSLVLQIEPSYTNTAFDTTFSTLIATNERDDIEHFILDRCMECAGAIAAIQEDTMNPIIQKACDYIEKNISQDINLEQLSASLNVSPFYLSKLFKEEKGANFISYVTALRMEKAKQLLLDYRLIIKEIASKVGYNDQNYFSKLFKQEFGLTPTEYRESKLK